MNIAICSPNKNAYSETFIQAHKERLKGNVYYYYGGRIPTYLENYGFLQNNRWERILHIIKGKWYLNKFSLGEYAFLRSLKANKIDVVLAEYGFTGQELYKVCEQLNIPLIVHFHGYDASNKKTIAEYKNYKDAFRVASYVIAVSKKMYQDLLDMGCPENKLRLTACGPNEVFFGIQPNFKKQQFISIGRFVEKKAPYYLILSFRKVLKEFPNAKLIFAARGALLPMCENLVTYFNLKDNIKFVGILSPEEFRNYLQDSLALVQHSITSTEGDMEGTPVGVLEAGAAGLPVISTYHAGIPDVIEHTKNGLLVDEHDVDGMAEHMCRLLREPAKAKEMGDAARRVIKEHFTLENHINLLNNLLKEAVKSYHI